MSRKEILFQQEEEEEQFYQLKRRYFKGIELPPLPSFPELPPVEFTTPEHLARRVAGIIAYAKNYSPFFRNKYEGIPIQNFSKASSPEEILIQIPPLTKHELTAVTEIYGKINNPLFTRPPYGTDYNTGGTSDHKAGIIYEKEEQEEVLRRIAELLAYVYVPGDRVIIASGQYPMWGGFPLNLLMWPTLPYMRTLPVGGGASSKELFTVFDEYRPTVIAGLSSSILKIIQTLRESLYFNPEILTQLTKVQFAGMPMSENMRRTLIEMVGHDLRFISHYTGSESWCTALAIDPNHPDYLYLSNNAIVEVVDPKTYESLRPGEEGTLLITRLNETLLPIIRYEIGDKGRIIPVEEYPTRVYDNARVIQLTGRVNPFEFVMAGLKVDSNTLIEQIKNITGASEAQIVQIGPNRFEFRLLMPQIDLTPDKREEVIRRILSGYFRYYPIDDKVGAQDYLSKSGLEITITSVCFDGFERTPIGKIKPFVKICE